MALCAACVAGAASPALALSDAELGDKLQAAIRGDRTGVCMVAALIEGTQVARARVCAAPRADGGPGLDHAFEIGSLSKSMVGFLVADLIEAGRWSLDDPIVRHLPPGTEVPRQGERQILVRDLVTHSSGLPPLPRRAGHVDPLDPYAALTERDLLQDLAAVKLRVPIGSRVVYSNFGAMVLSIAVARAYGDEFGGDLERALSARLFVPLGMTGAYVARPPAGTQVASGRTPDGQSARPWTWAAAPNAAGVGGVHARLQDMVRYAQAHLGVWDTPLAARLRATRQPVAHGAGIHWGLLNIQGRALVQHQGGTGGFSSIVSLDPEQQRAVVVLADTALTDLGGLAPLAHALLGLNVPLPRPRLEQPFSPAMHRALPGEYRLATLDLKIWEEDGRLWAQASRQPPLELRTDDHGDVFPAGASGLMQPVLDDGVMTRFAWRQGGGLMEGVRTSPARPAAAINPLWKSWAGSYELAPEFVLRVFEDSGRLMVHGSGQPAVEAAVTGTDRIEVKIAGAVIEFERDAGGAVVGLTLQQNGQVLRGPRRGAPAGGETSTGGG